MIEHHVAKTPGGHGYIRTESSGVITGLEMRALLSQLTQGGTHANTPILSVLANNASFEADARKAMTEMKNLGSGSDMPVACVIGSPLLRSFVKFVFLLTRMSRIAIFDDEPSAVAWLDSQIPLWKKHAPT